MTGKWRREGRGKRAVERREEGRGKEGGRARGQGSYLSEDTISLESGHNYLKPEKYPLDVATPLTAKAGTPPSSLIPPPCLFSPSLSPPRLASLPLRLVSSPPLLLISATSSSYDVSFK
jgi:hypothetical protein